MAIQNEAIQGLFSAIGIDPEYSSPALQSLAAADSRYIRDLKLNVAAVLGGSNIDKKQALFLALSVASNEKNETLIQAFQNLARAEGATNEEIAEVHACTSIMNANNVFYRFRHYLHQSEYYNNQPAGIRMSAMMNPVTGKEFFELMSLVVSAVNGCERCVTSHEHSVKQHGSGEARIYDAVRLAAVIKSLCAVV